MSRKIAYLAALIIITTAVEPILGSPAEDTLKDFDTISNQILVKIENFFVKQLLPHYQKARSNPLMSQVILVLMILIVFNSLVCNILKIFCSCGCKKVSISP